jgi:hypothetical protein
MYTSSQIIIKYSIILNPQTGPNLLRFFYEDYFKPRPYQCIYITATYEVKDASLVQKKIQDEFFWPDSE